MIKIQIIHLKYLIRLPTVVIVRAAAQSPWTRATVAGGLILALGLGIRQGFGLFLPPMTTAHGWGRETFSLAIAVQNADR